MMNIKRIIKSMVGDRFSEKIVRLKYGFLNVLCSVLPMNDEILFESHPDMSCNSYALYKHMLERGVNKRYKLTWLVREPEKHFPDIANNLDYIPLAPKGIVDKIKTYIRCNRAKASFACNNQLPAFCVSKKQINIYMDHGSHLKNMLVGDKRFRLNCGYLNCQSKFFVKYNVEQYTVESDQIIWCGLPRNDLLFCSNGSITRVVPDKNEFDKVILWAPTFRRHRRKERVDCDVDYPLGLPILYSEEDAVRLNRVLMEHKVLLIIKPHPASDMSVIKEQKLSNVRFLYNEDLKAAEVQLNEFMAQTDAMITDYSSIYYDYLLLDRPIGLTLDDYHEYSGQKGFVFDDPLEILKGDYMYNLEDLCAFAVSVAKGEDPFREERNQTKDLVHSYQDDCSSQRVCDFVLGKLDEIW